MNKAVLRQLRNGYKRDVDVDRVSIILKRFPLTTDPITGEQVQDPTGTKTEHKITCRIPHEKSQVPDDEENAAGLSTNLSRMIMADWENEFQEHDTFSFIGKGWEIGPVDTIRQFGGITGYQAPLKEA